MKIIMKEEPDTLLLSDSETIINEYTTLINMDHNICSDQKSDQSLMYMNIKKELDDLENESSGVEKGTTLQSYEETKTSMFEACYVKEEKYERELQPEDCKTVTENLDNFSNENEYEEFDNKKIENLENENLILHSDCEDFVQPGCSNNNESRETLVLGVKEFSTSHSGTYYQCNDCQKIFSARTSLNRHIKCVHRGIRNYKCNDCNKMFFEQSNLRKHIKNIHKRIKDYQCTECHKMFTTLAHLQSHVNCIHRQIKDFMCDICDKMFSRRGDLNSHKNSVHQRMKNYECLICHKTFFSLKCLRSHISSVHEGIKYFTVKHSISCNVCHKTLSSSSTLGAHMKRVHMKIKDHMCYYCKKMFFSRNELRRHINVVHTKGKQN